MGKPAPLHACLVTGICFNCKKKVNRGCQCPADSPRTKNKAIALPLKLTNEWLVDYAKDNMWSGFGPLPLKVGDSISLSNAERRKVDRARLAVAKLNGITPMRSATRQNVPKLKKITEGNHDDFSETVEMEDSLDDDDSDDEGGADENSDPELVTPVSTPAPNKMKMEPITVLSVICINEFEKKPQIGAASMSFDFRKPGISIYDILGAINKQAPAKWAPLTGKLGYKTSKTKPVHDIVSDENLDVVLQLLHKHVKTFCFFCYTNQIDLAMPTGSDKPLRTLSKVLSRPSSEVSTDSEQRLRDLYCGTCNVNEEHLKGCYREGDLHLLLTAQHIRQWVTIMDHANDTGCTPSKPPVANIFDMKNAKKISASLQPALSAASGPSPLASKFTPVTQALHIQTASCTFITRSDKVVEVFQNRVVRPISTVAILLKSVNFPGDRVFQASVDGAEVHQDDKLSECFPSLPHLQILCREAGAVIDWEKLLADDQFAVQALE